MAVNPMERPSMYPIFIEPKPTPAAVAKPGAVSKQVNPETSNQSGRGRKKHKARGQQSQAPEWVGRPSGSRGRVRFVS